MPSRIAAVFALAFVFAIAQPAEAREENHTNGLFVAQIADNSCKHANDGICDEPKYCDPGTDTADCQPAKYAEDQFRKKMDEVNSCKHANDGECDEPKGCDPGTDTSDCNPDKIQMYRQLISLAGSATGKTLKKCGAWNGQLSPNAIVDTDGNETKFGDLKCRWFDRSTHLHFAGGLDDVEAARWLIANGAEVNAKFKNGWTPLLWTAYKDSREVAELLIANGAEVNAKFKNGWTPLHKAAWRDSREVAELLIASGAEVNAKFKNGWTPMDQAISGGHSEMQSLLRSHGGRCNKKC